MAFLFFFTSASWLFHPHTFSIRFLSRSFFAFSFRLVGIENLTSYILVFPFDKYIGHTHICQTMKFVQQLNIKINKSLNSNNSIKRRKQNDDFFMSRWCLARYVDPLLCTISLLTMALLFPSSVISHNFRGRKRGNETAEERTKNYYSLHCLHIFTDISFSSAHKISIVYVWMSAIVTGICFVRFDNFS